MNDLIRSCGLVRGVVGSKVTDGVVRLGTVVAAHLIGVRCPEFALHLPDKIRKFAARSHTVDKRSVSLPDAVPVDLRHVGGPEVITLQAPCLMGHLAPLDARIERNAHAGKIDPAALSAGRLAGLLVDARPRGNDAQFTAGANQNRALLLRKRELRHLLYNGFALLLLEVVALQRALWLCFAHGNIVIERSFDREVAVQHFALYACNLTIDAFRNRECGDPLANAVEIYLQDGRFARAVRGLAGCLLLRGRIGRLRPPGLFTRRLGNGYEGRAQIAAERNEERPSAFWEPEVEMQIVINRIEITLSEKVEITSLRIESGLRIVQGPGRWRNASLRSLAARA